MKAFDFGSNWEAFSESKVDLRRLSIATRSIQSLLETNNLNGLSFLDIGCGSGIFSIAAHRLGASRVLGIDINPTCVVVSEKNRDRLAANAHITFCTASVLNSADLDSFGSFDLVYAWGSLHHTGAMWDAIQNATRRVSSGGILVLAIYNKHFTSPAWKGIKWLYNHLPRLGQTFLATFFAAIIYVAKFLATWRNPLEKERGMNFWFDVIDWVGGYPYEYATPDEVISFLKRKGFILRRMVTATVPTGCNEFVFTNVNDIKCTALTDLKYGPP